MMDGSDAAPRFVLDLVPREALRAVWPHVNRRIMSVVEGSRGELTIESVLRRLASNQWQLWVVSEGPHVVGIVITEIGVTDSGMRICNVKSCVGEDATQWLHLLSDIEGWAKANGCVRISTWARKGWAKRLKHYNLTHVMLERDL